MGFFKGDPAKIEQVPTMSPEQIQMQNSLIQGILQELQQKRPEYPQWQQTPTQEQLLPQGLQPGQYASNLFPDPGEINIPKFDFQPIEDKARQQFATKTVPGLAERFTAMGGQRSGSFGQQLGAAGADLEGTLAGQRAMLEPQHAQAEAALQLQRNQLQQARGGNLGNFAFKAGGMGLTLNEMENAQRMQDYNLRLPQYNLMGGLGGAQQSRFENTIQPGRPGIVGRLLGFLGKTAPIAGGAMIGGLAGGPGGAVTGASIGAGVNKWF